MSIKNYSDINKMDDLMIPLGFFESTQKQPTFFGDIRPSKAAGGTDRPIGPVIMDSQTANAGFGLINAAKILRLLRHHLKFDR